MPHPAAPLQLTVTEAALPADLDAFARLLVRIGERTPETPAPAGVSRFLRRASTLAKIGS
jgi:hypothetical protein